MPDCSVESLIPLIGAANHSLAHWHIGILAYLKDYERRNYRKRREREQPQKRKRRYPARVLRVRHGRIGIW